MNRGALESGSMTLLDEAIAALAHAGIESARLDAELLLAEACGASRGDMIAGASHVTEAQAQKFRAMVKRRSSREPIAYIIGRKEFFSLEFEVTPAVLIPRPETETIVDAALDYLTVRPNARVLDIGTGS